VSDLLENLDGVPKYKSRAPRSREKKFGIERRYTSTAIMHISWMLEWAPWKWYVTEAQRDQALETLQKHHSIYDHREFRKCQR